MQDRQRMAHNAIKLLYPRLYEIEKDMDFKFPDKKPGLQEYCIKLRTLLDEVLDVAGINRITQHEFEVPTLPKEEEPKTEENTEEN